MDADGANRRQFAKTRLAVDSDGQVIWAPGRNILYQKPMKRNYSVLDPETDPKYSPDGKKLAVAWNRPPQGGIWVISPIDNSQTFLWSGSRFPAGWSPDGSSIYAYRGNNMLSIPADTAGRGTRIPFLRLRESSVVMHPGSGLACQGCASVSPNGKKFVYSAGETKSDVWVVDNFDPANRK